MAKYRLSALTIFIILLAVLLIGYLMHHKWENFKSSWVEGFNTDYTTSTLAQTLDGYSVNNKKVVKLYDDIYFDPVSKALIKKEPGKLVMKKKDGTEVKHTIDNIFKLESIGAGYVAEPDNKFILDSDLIYNASDGYDRYRGVEAFSDMYEGFTTGSEESSSKSINVSIPPPITLAGAKKRILRAASRSSGVRLDGTFDTGRYIYATVTFDSRPAEGKTIDTDDTIKVKSIFIYYARDINTSPTGDNYPVLDEENILDENSPLYPWRFKILSETDNFDVTGVVTTNTPKNIAWKTDKEVAIISMPLVIPNPIDSKNNSHSVTFIHVMDMKNNKHVATYYFNGNQVEKYTYNKKIVDKIASDKTIYDYTSGTKTDFSGEIKNISTPYYTSQENIKTDVSHNTEAKTIYLAARVGDNMVRANIKVTESTITIDKAEVSHAQSSTDSSSSTDTSTDSSSSSSTDTSTDSSSSTDTSTDSTSTSTSTSDVSPSNSTDTNSKFSELTSTLALMKTMKSLFSSSDNDYFLKTEVVPPVCPSCPSCPHSNGVCTNCGGNGGSGTQVSNGNDSASSLARDAGTGATNLARDAASGADNLARDAASGTVDVASDAASATYGAAEDVAGGASSLARDAASGTYNAAQYAASGASNLARDTASGAYGAAKDVAGGASSLARDTASGAYGVAKDITQGTVGLGRDFASGVGNLFGAGPTSQAGGYQNSYGGPSYNHNQGGYMNPRQYTAHGQDPYSYYGAVPPRSNGCNFVPRTANFSSFGR